MEIVCYNMTVTQQNLLFQVSFVIPPDVVPGRMGLLITSLLVLVNLFVSITRESPNADSFTTISTWMIVCIFFVCSATWEYFCILMVKHFNYYLNCSKDSIQIAIVHTDSICLVFSILMFCAFNIAFWLNI